MNDSANKLDAHNRRYAALCLFGSLLGAYSVCLLVLWLAQLAGFPVLYWWPGVAGIALASGFQLASALADRRYKRAASTNASVDYLQAARCVAVQAKYTARVFWWFIPLAFLAPVISTIFSISPKLYLMICFAILLSLANSIGRARARSR